MTKKTTWGARLKEFRTVLNLSMGDLSQRMSSFGDNLSSAERMKLSNIDAEAAATLDTGNISRLENDQLRPPKRERVLFFIAYFIHEGVINLPQEASAWLELANHRGITNDAECEALFGYPLSKFDSSNSLSLVTSPSPVNHSDVRLPRSYLPRHHNAFFSGHEQLVKQLLEKLLPGHGDSCRIFILHGPHGMGKKRIALEIGWRLKKRGVPVIFHSVDHITTQEYASAALNSFVDLLSECFDLPITGTIQNQMDKIKRTIEDLEYQVVLLLDGLRNEIEEVFIQFLEWLPPNVKVLLTYTTETHYAKLGKEGFDGQKWSTEQEIDVNA